MLSLNRKRKGSPAFRFQVKKRLYKFNKVCSTLQSITSGHVSGCHVTSEEGRESYSSQ